LLNRLNLERLSQIRRDEAEPEIRSVIASLLEKEAEKTPLSLYERESIVVDVLNELFGLGPLESLLLDPEISDILVNRHDQIYIEKNGMLEPVDAVFKDDRHLMRIIERIVSTVGRRIDESSPMVDARLPDGSRVNAIIPPLALDVRCCRSGASNGQAGRRISPSPVDHRARDGVLRAAVSCRLNITIRRHRRRQDDGERAVQFHFRQERIVTIEDAAELTPASGTPLETRREHRRQRRHQAAPTRDPLFRMRQPHRRGRGPRRRRWTCSRR
jgi:pilus assembly protein CpaF